MKTALGAFGALAVATSAAGCLQYPTTDVGRDREPIFQGAAARGGIYEAVVAVGYGPQYPYFCSGTLITDDVVLTAGHCLHGDVAADIQVYFGENVYQRSGDFRPAARILVKEDYDDYWLVNDIALIRMKSPAPGSVRPVPFLPAASGLEESDEGASVDYAGFGLTEEHTDGVRLHNPGRIEDVCPGPRPCAGGIEVPRSFSYSMATGGPCSGDSGGPTFLERERPYVAGVTSYGDKDCLDFGVNTTVSAYSGWINSFLADGGSEQCTDGVDDDGNGLIDCEDPACRDVACAAVDDVERGDDGGCRAGGAAPALSSTLGLLIALAAVGRRRGLRTLG